ncbi:unnamed protein product [Phyllotreta striolata]|uniref:Phosphatidic acid phosphatase type 2/haloperoxidase domain-containing protein n=1 Tax=Phyllotreta striolata TaxID=444603 RepID=A0A9N9XJ35_PHYSR|nr:unnamed protein product [Phyllotreta striolata]
MGAVLAVLGVDEPVSYEPPSKKILCNIYGVQISLAHITTLLISVIVLTLTILLEYGTIPAVQQGFYCGDPQYSHKYKGETVTPEILGVTAVLVPLFIIISTELLAYQSFRKINPYTVVFYMQECIVGVALVLLLTSITKVIVGEHRPHFFDTCQPDTAVNCTAGQFVETFTCTSEYSQIFKVDSSLSFFSGHSSISWFIAIYLCYIIHVRTVTVNAGYIIKPFLISLVLTWSLLCSLSRITDRRHHWWDVLTGSLFGICSALYFAVVVYEKMKKNDPLVRSYKLTEEIPLSIHHRSAL